MATQKNNKRNILALTGAAGTAALLVFAVNFAISAITSKHKKKVLKGSNVQINLSASQILKLADQLIAKSKAVHDAVASVPLDKVSYKNVISPLVELETKQFPLLQSCIFPKMVSVAEDVRKASAEAERRIDAYVTKCSKREDLYLVVKAVAMKGEIMSPEANRYTQFLVKEFERNGLNLTLAKREELQRLKTQIDDLCIQYIRNINDDCSVLHFTEKDLLGLPPSFLQSLDKAENGKFKITLGSHHLLPVLEFCKDITKPIKDEICDSLKRWRSSFSALKLKQEILYCLFDQIIHANENVDIIGLFKHLHPKVMVGLPMLEGTNPASCFTRSAIGYEAVCYSRIWSEVFAADIYASKFRDNVFNYNAGKQFREKVLGPGGAKDPVEILLDFLGREPSIQAFTDSKTESI